jgi:hypothetical protein
MLRSMSNNTSMRLTPSSATGEIAATVLPRRALDLVGKRRRD